MSWICKNELWSPKTSKKSDVTLPFGLELFQPIQNPKVLNQRQFVCRWFPHWLSSLIKYSRIISYRGTGKSTYYCQQWVDRGAVVITVSCWQCRTSRVGVVGRESDYLQTGWVNMERDVQDRNKTGVRINPLNHLKDKQLSRQHIALIPRKTPSK